MSQFRPSSPAIARLRARIERIERGGAGARGPRPAGGARAWRDLAPGALYEIAGRDWRDGPAGEAYALALAAERSGDVFLVRLKSSAREEGLSYAPECVLYGLSAARLTLCFARNMKALLWTAEEAARAGDGTVIVAANRRHRLLDLTATRRLQLAAEASGATAILLRHPGDREATSAARRFRVAAAPSAGAPFDSEAPGPPRWRVEIERCRLGKRGAWVVEWDDERRELREAETVSLSSPAALADRPMETALSVA